MPVKSINVSLLMRVTYVRLILTRLFCCNEKGITFVIVFMLVTCILLYWSVLARV